MNIEPKASTRKGPADWFTGDVWIDAILGRKAELGLIRFDGQAC